MSRILRRPMFRGGPVSSYGTGIAAPLVPGYKGGGQIGGGIIYGKPMMDGRYGFQNPTMGGIVTIQDILSQVKAPMTGQQILDYAMENNLNLGENFKINKYSKYVPEEVDVEVGTDGDWKTQSWGEFIADKGMPEIYDKDYLGKEDPQGSIGDKVDTGGKRTFTSDFGTTEEIAQKLEKKDDDTDGADNNELLSLGDDPSNLETGDLEAMIARYEKILGGDKAFSQDVGDMAFRLAGAKGNTVMEKLQNWFGDEAKAGPSRTEKIKQAAGMLGIKGEQAKEIAALQATGKLYAPGITQKTAMYIKSLPKGSAEHATALAQIKWPPTLDRKIAEDQMSGPVTLDDIDVYAGVYIDNYKGRLVEGAIDGVYLNAGDSSLVWVDDKGEVIRTKQLDIK